MTQRKLISWNVNGLRAVWKKGFADAVARMDADIIAIQETKIQGHQLTEEMAEMPGYQSFWSHASSKKGYSGVGIYSRIAPMQVAEGIGIPAFDREGRILRMDLEDFVLFNIYFPNGQTGEERLAYKLSFYEALFDHIEPLRQEGRHIVITGDYNTAHNEIDLKNPKANENTSGFMRIERDWIDRIIGTGYVDTFRHFHPDTVKYSWWTYRFKARERNVGWRIDYFFTSRSMIEEGMVLDAFIDNSIEGSDHCPVGLLLKHPA